MNEAGEEGLLPEIPTSSFRVAALPAAARRARRLASGAGCQGPDREGAWKIPYANPQGGASRGGAKGGRAPGAGCAAAHYCRRCRRVRGVDAMAGPAWISKVSAGQARMWLAGVLGAGRELARGPR